MTKEGHWLQGLADLFRAPTGDLRTLAQIAGEDPRTLFIGTALDGTDLRGQDLRGMRFTHLDLSKVRHDAQTQLDSASGTPTPRSKSEFSFDDLLSSALGSLYGAGHPQLPAPPMLLFDRVTAVTKDGGAYGKGTIEAEFDIHPSLWFFDCHYLGDPLMPSSLALDALGQLIGFYLGWGGGKGRVRAVGHGEVWITGEVTPMTRRVTYKVEIKRIVNRRLILGIGDGVLEADGKSILTAKDIRVGLYRANEPTP